MLAVLCMADFSVTAYASGGEQPTVPPDDEIAVETPVSDETGESVEIPFHYTTDEDGNLVITIDGISETVKITATGTVVTGGSRLNLRTGAGLDYEIIDQLRPGESLIRMLIMWTMTRTMGTIRSLRTTMKIAPSMKMIMNLCKQDRLDAWGSLRVAFTYRSSFSKTDVI